MDSEDHAMTASDEPYPPDWDDYGDLGICRWCRPTPIPAGRVLRYPSKRSPMVCGMCTGCTKDALAMGWDLVEDEALIARWVDAGRPHIFTDQ